MAAAMPVTADVAPAAGPRADDGSAAATAIDLDAIESRVERSLVKKVRKLIDDFPERSLDVIRGWMAEDRR